MLCSHISLSQVRTRSGFIAEAERGKISELEGQARRPGEQQQREARVESEEQGEDDVRREESMVEGQMLNRRDSNGELPIKRRRGLGGTRRYWAALELTRGRRKWEKERERESEEQWKQRRSESARLEYWYRPEEIATWWRTGCADGA